MTTYANVISELDVLRKKVAKLSAQDDETFNFLDAIVRAIGYGYVSSAALSCGDDHTIRIHYDSRDAMNDASDAIYRIISKYNKDRGLTEAAP